MERFRRGGWRWRVVWGICLISGAIVSVAEERPNILFVYTDDQGPWALGAVNPEFHTPIMDRLFSEGATLTNAFVTTPVCSPSRAGLLASRHGTEVGITDWINPRGGKNQRNEIDLGLDPGTPTWVRELQGAGYATALIGKWHLGTEDRFHPTRFGYEHFAGFRPGGNRVENPTLEIDGEERAVEGLTMDILTDLALEWLEVAEEPFLMSLHYRAPHAPWLPVADSDMAPYEERAMTIPDPDFPDLDHERVERSLREYAASVTGVDRNLGRVLAWLDARGLRDKTVVIFTSDHGYNIGHHGIIHKGNGGWITHATRGLPSHEDGVARPNMWDTSLRVPAAVRWPGVIEAGSTVTECITNLDWYPTILAMAGVGFEPDYTIHGRDFLPLLRGEAMDWEDAFYGEYDMHHYTEASLRMWRTREWKLVRDFKRAGQDELYDLVNDPGETVNVIEEGRNEAVRERLNGLLLDKMGELGDAVLMGTR